MFKFEYDSPKPSQCDNCKNAYYVEDGSLSIGDKTYKQRYCSTKGSKADNGNFFQGISIGGFDNCPTFESEENEKTI